MEDSIVQRLMAMLSRPAGPTVPVSSNGFPTAPTVKPFDDSFNTRLLPQEEQAFQGWKARFAPHDSGADYDLRGAFKAGLSPDPASGHWPDTFKKPNHPTFSNESMYAPYGNPGRWDGDRFVPPHQQFPMPTNVATVRG